MSKTLVAYFSRTGNTKMVAETIHRTLGGDALCLPLDKVEGMVEFRLIFIGFPVQAHSVPFPVERFLKSIPAGKPIALFSTHGAVPEHRLAKQALEYAAVLTGHCRLLGTFHCRGKLSMQALEVFARSPEHREWSEMAPSAASHPDTHDLAEAALFAGHMKALAAEPGNKAGRT
jgi:flavodoxin